MSYLSLFRPYRTHDVFHALDRQFLRSDTHCQHANIPKLQDAMVLCLELQISHLFAVAICKIRNGDGMYIEFEDINRYNSSILFRVLNRSPVLLYDAVTTMLVVIELRHDLDTRDIADKSRNGK